MNNIYLILIYFLRAIGIKIHAIAIKTKAIGKPVSFSLLFVFLTGFVSFFTTFFTTVVFLLVG